MSTASSRRPSRLRQGESGRRGLRRVPLAAWVCALIAFANGVCWAATTPPFWVPDEPAGTGFVQYVAENGELPKSGSFPDFSEEQASVPFTVEGRPPWLEATSRAIQRSLDRDLTRTSPGQAYYLINYPPLYYALEVIPYRIAYDANFLDRVFAMRVFSALFAALTVLFAFLFIRELLPSTPWAWTVGGLCVAFQPMFGFMSGGVQNDNLLYTASAALFFCLARAFRRGLTPGLGVGLGLALAVGLLTKQTILGLLPGAVLGLAFIVWRTRGPARRLAVKGAAAAAAVGLLPWIAWLAVNNLVLDRSANDTGGIASSASGGGASITGLLSYMWQALLPRLPFMNDFFGYYPPYEIYFQGFIGRFGWAEYGFPLNWNRVALGFFVVLTALVVRELWIRRETLRARWAEPLTYLAMFAGLLFVIEVAAYRYHLDKRVAYFEQARYLLPLLSLYGGFVALAARGAGRRWGPAVGAFLVVLAMGHTLAALLLTVSRFYT